MREDLRRPQRRVPLLSHMKAVDEWSANRMFGIALRPAFRACVRAGGQRVRDVKPDGERKLKGFSR